MNHDSYKILIIDDEEDIRDIVEMAFQSHGNFEYEHASSGKDAILKCQNQHYDLVICDYNMPNGNGGEVYRYFLNQKNEMRYVLCSTDHPENHSEFEDKSCLFFHIEKPCIIDGVKACFNKWSPSAILIDTRQDDFLPVSTNILLKIDSLPSDIYLKINDKKFLKIFHKNETFDEIDFVKYSQRSIYKLYVRNAEFYLIQNKAEYDLVKSLELLQKNPDKLQKPNILVSTHDLIHGIIQEYDITSQIIKESALEVYNITQEFIHQSKDMKILLSKILHDKSSYISKHSILLGIVTSLLVKELNWSNPIMIKKLVAASLFHDIGLKDDINETTHQLSGQSSNLLAFKEHPQRAAEIIKNINCLPPQTDIIILEQHEIGTKRGFPKSIPFTKISPLGLVFSFSHFFVDYIIEFSSFTESLEKMQEISQECSQYKVFYKALHNIQFT